MSRSIKGAKSPGFDYWSRRPVKGSKSTASAGYGPEVKRLTNRNERRRAGVALKREET